MLAEQLRVSACYLRLELFVEQVRQTFATKLAEPFAGIVLALRSGVERRRRCRKLTISIIWILRFQSLFDHADQHLATGLDYRMAAVTYLQLLHPGLRHCFQDYASRRFFDAVRAVTCWAIEELSS